MFPHIQPRPKFNTGRLGSKLIANCCFNYQFEDYELNWTIQELFNSCYKKLRAWFFFQWDLNGSTITKNESGHAMKSLQKKRIRSCNEVFIAKKKESGRVPFIDSKWSSVEVEMELRFYHTKSQWSSELYLNSIWCPTTTFQQPQALPYSRPPAPPTTTPPHHEAFLFVPCSLSPTSTLEYINKKLHHYHHELH